MDMPLYMRVLWRFKRMVLIGLLLACALAFLAYFRVGFAGGSPHLAPRGKETWASYARIFVTRRGFEWGSSIIGPSGTPKTADASRISAQVSEEGRLAGLASIYSNFAESDPVRRIMLKDGGGPIHGQIQAAALPITQNNPYVLLPLISIAGLADSAEASRVLAGRTSDALVKFITNQQDANGVPAHDRILLTVLNRAGETKLLSGRPKALPVISFMMVLLATVGIAFLRENLNPAQRKLEPVKDSERRSA